MKPSVKIKGINVMLVISMIWMGSGSYLPTAYAETTTAPVQETPPASTLSKLEIEGIELSQKFSGDLFEYSAAVENKVQTIKLLVESSNTDSSITINGQEVISGTASNYSLQTGVNIFHISVNDGSSTTISYTLTITREESSNNLLESIELSQGQLAPKFSSSVTEYNVAVPNSFPNITIKPTSVDPTSTIKVNGTPAEKAGVEVELPVGKSDILIEVTAKNSEKKTYTLHLTRAAAEKENDDNPIQDNKPDSSQPTSPKINQPSTSQPTSPKNNRPSTSQPTTPQQSSSTLEKTSTALLASLSVSEGSWDSSFTSEEFTYHLTVSSNVDTVTINPVATYSSSEILTEGSTSKTVKLDDDKKTTISIVVKNGDDRKTYVLVFDKES
jgi:hypothetical protein